MHAARGTLLLLAASLVACGPASEEDGATAPGDSISTALTADPTQRAQVQAACHGTYGNAGACQRCVNNQTTEMQQQGTITASQAAALRQSFAKDCQQGCIPTTCEIAGAECGTVSDGCGGQLSCPSLCVSGQTCEAGMCRYPLCVPYTNPCEVAGVQCGHVNNGCDREYSCGQCGYPYSGQVCAAGICVPQ